MISALLLTGSLVLGAPGSKSHAAPAPSAAEVEEYSTFEEAAADLDKPAKISTWEAFLERNPSSPFAPKVRTMIAELKGRKAAPKPPQNEIASTAPAAATVTDDPDLSFLYESPARAVPPAATEAVAAPAIFPTPTPEPAPAAAPEEPSIWDAAPAKAPAAPKQKRLAANTNTRAPRMREVARAHGPRTRRAPTPAVSRSMELAVFHGFSPADAGSGFGTEAYVTNSLTGVTLSRHITPAIALEVEGAAARPAETTLLQGERAQGRQPAVLTKLNYVAGAGVQLGILSGSRNDLFVHGGGGVVDANLEVCKPGPGNVPCEKPLFFEHVNFEYATVGAGHRFYVTSRIALHTELRGRLLFEKIDGVTTPRAAVMLNIGPSVSF